MSQSPPLLEVRDLRTTFVIDERNIAAVDGVSFDVALGETVGVVGESGSGKSVTMLSIMRLLPSRGTRVTGEIRFQGRNLLTLPAGEMRRVRGNRIGMIFQEPMTALNPVFTVGFQIGEVLLEHQHVNKAEARRRGIELLRSVGIPAPERRFDEFPHQLSGGMRQRIMIAMALACGPALLIADEPTTALDVTIQAQILDLIRDLKSRTEMAVLFVTHNLGVVAEVASRVVVMYAGQVVEEGPVAEVFARPQHPYTEGLLTSIPSMDTDVEAELSVIPGSVPTIESIPGGCRFHPRCPYVMEHCRTELPPMVAVADNHHSRCWLRVDPSQEDGAVAHLKEGTHDA